MRGLPGCYWAFERGVSWRLTGVIVCGMPNHEVSARRCLDRRAAGIRERIRHGGGRDVRAGRTTRWVAKQLRVSVRSVSGGAVPGSTAARSCALSWSAARPS